MVLETTNPALATLINQEYLRQACGMPIPDDIKSSISLITFEQKLKNFYLERLGMVFEQDNVRTYKLICVKCRSINILVVYGLV